MIPDINTELVNVMLDIYHKTIGASNLSAIHEVAGMHLAQMNSELELQLRPPPVEVPPVEEAA